MVAGAVAPGSGQECATASRLAALERENATLRGAAREAAALVLRRWQSAIENLEVDGGEGGERMPAPTIEPAAKRIRTAEVAGAHIAQHLRQQVAVKEEAEVEDEQEQRVEDEREQRGYQIRALYALQTQVDELAELAIAAGANPVAVATIKSRVLG